MKITRKCNLLFGSFYLLLYPTLIMFSSYMMLMGASSEQIALYLVVLGAFNIVTKPLFANYVDKGECKKMIVLLGILIIIGTSIFFSSKEISTIGCYSYIILVSTATSGIMESIDSWVLKLSVEFSEIDYSKHRSCGSLSFAIISIVFGFLLAKYGLTFARISIYVLVCLFEMIAMLLPNPSIETKKEENVNLKDVKELLINKQFVIFTISFALGCCLVDVSDNYLGVLVLEKGGSTAYTGTYDFIKAFVEFFVMFGCTRLIEKYGLKQILIVSYLGMFLKCALAAIMPTALGIVFTSVTQAFGFPLLIPAKMVMIKKLVNPKQLGLAMSISAVVISLLFTFVCNPLISYLAPIIGTSKSIIVLSTFGIFAALGTVLFQKEGQ